MFNDKNVLVSLTSSMKLTSLIARHLKAKILKITTKRFADGEIIVKSEESIRNKNVFIIHSISKPVNDSLMELLIAIDSFKRASAKKIILICPYFGYARQDRKTEGREPITSKLVVNLLETSGLDQICVIDIHSEQIQGFFEIPADIMTSSYLIASEMLSDIGTKNVSVVSPDYGCVKRARKISTKWNLPLTILDKRRPKPNVAEIANILGDVKNKNCIVIDDMIDTGGTICKACEILKKNGAKSIYVGASHGLFSNNAIQNFNKLIDNKIIKNIYVTNSIDNVYDLKLKNLHIIDLSKFISLIIKVYCNEKGSSISKIYDMPLNKYAIK